MISRGMVITVDRALIPEDACSRGRAFLYRIPNVFKVSRGHTLLLRGLGESMRLARVLSYRAESALIRVELESVTVKDRLSGGK